MTTTDAATQDEVQRPTPTLRKRERSEEEVVEESVKDVPASAADEASAPVKKQRQAASMASTPSDKKDASVTDAPSDETTAPASAHVQEHASDATNTEASSAKEAAALATTTSDAKSTEAVSSHEEAPSATNESDKATEGMPEPSAKKSTQPTFSSFASSASPFASSKSTSQLGFGAFAARAAPFQSATALSSKAEAAATTEKEKKDWVKDDSESAASPQPEDIVVRKKEVPKPDIELTTGEEDDTTVHSVRAKLYSLSDAQVWKERGTGTIKINRNEKSHTARLVMRSDAVLRLILNVQLFPGMQCSLEQERFLRFAAMEPEGLTHFAIKLGSAYDATTFLSNLQENIPASSDKAASTND